MLSQDTLRDMTVRYRLSDNELEVLPLALAGKSISSIATQLAITDNAVRKRLSGIYLKLGISESGSGRGGPGRLKDLQQFVETNYHSRKLKRVLICRFGMSGKRIAEILQETILSHPSLETQVSVADFVVNQSKISESEYFSEDFDYVLVCLTRDDAEESSLLVNFVLGFLSGRSRNLNIISFGGNLSLLLGDILLIDGANLEAWVSLLEKITSSNEEQARGWVKVYFERLIDAIEKFDQISNEGAEKIFTQADELKVQVENEFKRLKRNDTFVGNLCFQTIVLHSVAATYRQMTQVSSNAEDLIYSIPAVLYPHYLIELQETYSAQVEAVAIVNGRESFWSEQTGRKIWETAQKESKRIFVFKRLQDFDRLFETLLEHAAKYDVFAMSYENLVGKCGWNEHDFAILRVNKKDEVVAKYDSLTVSDYRTLVCFNPDKSEVDRCKDELKKIIANKEIVISMEDAHKQFLEKAKAEWVNTSPIDTTDAYFSKERTKNKFWKEIREEFGKLIFHR